MTKRIFNRQAEPSDLRNEIAARRARVQPHNAPFDFRIHGHRWCVARAIVRGGRITKVPTNLSGCPLDITQSGAGTLDLTSVISQFEHDPLAIGIGLILAGNGIVALDFDHCLMQDGWHPIMVSLVEESRSYTEISSGGDGVHLFLSAADAARRYQNRKCRVADLQIERYSHSRFIACTFARFPGAGEFIEKHEGILGRINAMMGSTSHLPRQAKNGMVIDETSPLYLGPTSPGMSDQQVLSKCRGAKNTQKFHALYELGDVEIYHNGDHSRADQSLLQMLSFYTQSPTQLERLFGSSALGLRDKWTTRIDYRFNSIVAALLKHGAVQ